MRNVYGFDHKYLVFVVASSNNSDYGIATQEALLGIDLQRSLSLLGKMHSGADGNGKVVYLRWFH